MVVLAEGLIEAIGEEGLQAAMGREQLGRYGIAATATRTATCAWARSSSAAWSRTG